MRGSPISRKINVGIIGTGFVSDQFHMPAYREIGANVVSIAGREQAKVESFARRWGIKNAYHGENAVERICRDAEVDVVDICLPNHLHLNSVILASENHKNVICEKPLARNAREAKKALDVANRYGAIHCYAENQIFIPQVSRAIEFIASGAIGNVNWVRTREAHSGPHSEWFWNPRLAGGGVLTDMGCHSLEVARRLINRRPITVNGWCDRLVHAKGGEDNSLILVKYGGGALGQSENSWSALGGLDIRFEVYGSEGALFMDLTRETGVRMFTASNKQSAYVVEKADVERGWVFPTWLEFETYGYLGELRHFLESAALGAMPSETFEDGYNVNLMIDAAYASSREGKWVNLPKARH